jgi:hypothetical protein
MSRDRLFNLRVSEEELKTWRAAAGNQSLSSWMRDQANWSAALNLELAANQATNVTQHVGNTVYYRMNASYYSPTDTGTAPASAQVGVRFIPVYTTGTSSSAVSGGGDAEREL